MKKSFFYFLLVISLFQLNSPPASAANGWLQYQTSPADIFNRTDLLPEYDLSNVIFGVSETKPDEYWFVLQFSKPVSSNLFADSAGSWAGVFIDINNDNKFDYSLQTDTTPYNGNYEKAGRFVDRSSATPVDSSKCLVKTWTNLTTSASWVAFSLKKNCLDFSNSIGIQGYSDQTPNDNAGFDYAPEALWRVNVDAGTVSNSGSASSSIVPDQLPSVSSEGISLISSPSTPPQDLVSLAAETTKSVVTVLCGNGIGSGWSIKASLSSSNTTNGFKSYIITNHHVIADCTTTRNVTLILSNQSRVMGYVYSWDETNDVAGILTSTSVPGLNWRGATPQQGWWVAAIGSPLGFPGILTTGIVSSVNSTTFLGTTNAAINPGNSGGPVFDRTGRVIGLATAKYVNSEGFGIFHGTPKLCQKIVACSMQGVSQIWTGANSSNSDTTSSDSNSTGSNSDSKKIDQYITYSPEVSDSSLSKISLTFSATSTSGLKVKYRSEDSNVCAFEMNKIILMSEGTCTIYMDQVGDSKWNPASTSVLRFTVLPATSPNKVVAKVTQVSHEWAAWIDSIEYVKGANPLTSNSLTTIRISGNCTKAGKKVQIWKNTDSSGKKYAKGSKPFLSPIPCNFGQFEGLLTINGGTKVYVVELPKSRVGTTIEFRKGQILEDVENVL
ncbi:Trypsin-like peptidase domain containing protein [Candidatus Nanopelagicaceae bacterium]